MIKTYALRFLLCQMLSMYYATTVYWLVEDIPDLDFDAGDM